MVPNITSLTGNGLKDWLVQRVSALYLGVYLIFLLGFIVWHPQLNYAEWRGLFACAAFKIATILAFINFSLHAWVGLWTVTTDYLHALPIRLLVQMGVLLCLSTQLVWGVMIVWGL